MKKRSNSAGTFLRFCVLVGIWLIAYKTADLFAFFRTYSSLWFLPAGATIAIVFMAPRWLKLAPLVANLLLAIPAICWALGITLTNYRDPILHSFRLYAIYGGTALILAHVIKVHRPSISLRDIQWVIGLTLIGAGLAALTGVSLHAVVGNIDWPTGWSIVVPWAIGDAIGAIILPPLLVPLLLLLFPKIETEWQWPSGSTIAFQIVAILAALAVGMLIPRAHPDLGSLWYVIIVPPVFFALRGGLPAAATSVFLTSLLAPPAAFLFDFHGERLGLQLLLLISSIAGLLVGAAISDRRRAFDDLKAQQSQLEQVVAERTRDLEEAYDFQRHLVRSIGHDLRQPVQSMNMMLDGLAMEMAQSNSATAILHMREMGAAASDLLSKIVSYARLDAGRVAPDLQQFPVQRLFAVLERIYAPVARAKGVKLIIPATDLSVISDEQLILEVLSNYLDNALRLSAEGQTVTLQHEHSAGRSVFKVRDEVQPKENPQQGAAGFGLEIVHRIAKLLNAQVVAARNEMGISV